MKNLCDSYQNSHVLRTGSCNSSIWRGVSGPLLLLILACTGCSNPADQPVHFENSAISFDYIKYYTEDLGIPSIDNEIEVLLCRSSRLSPIFLQVSRMPHRITMDELYNQKKSATAVVLKEHDSGNEDDKVAKYAATRMEVNGKSFVRVYAKRASGDQSVSYQLIHKGYEYNLNFIYPKEHGLVSIASERFGYDDLDKDNNHDGDHVLMTLRSLKFKG